MTSKDLKIIDDLIERFENLPKVVDLRVKAKWENLPEDEYDLVFDTYKKLDDILVELNAFISVKFNNRQDLIYKWNLIDFDPKIGGFKINTNDPNSIKSAWFDGMSSLRSLLKSMRAEVVLFIAEDNLKNDNSKNLKQTNILGGQVIINEHPNRGNQSLLDNALTSPIIQTTKTKTNKTKTKSKPSLLEVFSWIAAIIGTIIALITLIYYLKSI